MRDFSDASDLIDIEYTDDGYGGGAGDDGATDGAGPGTGGAADVGDSTGGPYTGGGAADIPSGPSTQQVVIPRSDQARGLALTEINVTKGWDGLLSFLKKRQQIYFLSLAFDLSGEPPQVMPPKELSGDTFIRVKPGETFRFTLGDGAPLFLPRQIVGGVALYIQICEADDVARAGATLSQIHDDLAQASGSFLDNVKNAIKNPAGVIVSTALNAGFALLKPVATILQSNKDDSVGLVQGTFPAKKSWDGRLIQDFSDGSYLKLAEVTE